MVVWEVGREGLPATPELGRNPVATSTKLPRYSDVIYSAANVLV